MTDIASLLAYVGFVALGLGTVWAQRAGPVPARRWSSGLILYVLFVSFGAPITRRNLWPFAHWRMMQNTAPVAVGDTGISLIRAVAFTSEGIEYPIDYRAWEPFTHEELLTWLMRDFPSIAPGRRDSIGAFLLAGAEAARIATREGRHPGPVSRALGPLAAPSHLLFAKRWRTPADVPANSFVGVRIYREYWTVEVRARDPDAIQLKLAYQYPEPP